MNADGMIGQKFGRIRHCEIQGDRRDSNRKDGIRRTTARKRSDGIYVPTPTGPVGGTTSFAGRADSSGTKALEEDLASWDSGGTNLRIIPELSPSSLRMPLQSTHPLTVENVSQLVEEDILRRGLKVGERYFTADEAGQRFGVSRTQAHRAFQLLAHRNLLISKPRKGTVIGPAGPFKALPEKPLQCVHALLDPERIRAGLSMGELIEGLRRGLPGSDVQLNYLPAGVSTSHVQQICERLADAGAGGLVLFGCPRPVQEFVAQQSVAAVNFGVVYPTAQSLPCVTVDNTTRGRLLAEHLLDQGCERLALMLPEFWLPGYRQVFEGVNQALAARRLSYGTLELCNIPHDEASIRTEVRRLLALGHAPTGWILQGQFAEPAIAELKALRASRKVRVALDVADPPPELRHLPHCQPELGFQQRVALAADMLKRLLDGQALTEPHVVVPVHLSLALGS